MVALLLDLSFVLLIGRCHFLRYLVDLLLVMQLEGLFSLLFELHLSVQHIQQIFTLLINQGLLLYSVLIFVEDIFVLLNSDVCQLLFL